MLGNEIKKERIYLNINKEGKLVKTSKDGKKEYFSEVTGYFDKINLADRTYNGETVKVWYLTLSDNETKEEYILSFSYGSGVFKSIVMSLDSVGKTLRREPIKISPYVANGFTKAVVYHGENKLSWSGTLPPVQKVTLNGGKEVIDDSDRMNYIKDLVQALNISDLYDK